MAIEERERVELIVCFSFGFSLPLSLPWTISFSRVSASKRIWFTCALVIDIQSANQSPYRIDVTERWSIVPHNTMKIRTHRSVILDDEDQVSSSHLREENNFRVFIFSSFLSVGVQNGEKRLRRYLIEFQVSKQVILYDEARRLSNGQC